MKTVILFFIFILSPGIYAQEKDFHLKSIFKDQKSLEDFTTKLMAAQKFDSAEQVNAYLDEATQGMFFHDYVVKTPLISEFFYQLSNQPAAIASAISIFITPNNLLIFFLGMLFSFMAAHILADFQYHFKPFGLGRMLYFPLRVSAVNVFRLWLVVHCFGTNLKPLTQVYFQSLSVVRLDHQNLYIFSNFLKDLISVI